MYVGPTWDYIGTPQHETIYVAHDGQGLSVQLWDFVKTTDLINVIGTCQLYSTALALPHSSGDSSACVLAPGLPRNINANLRVLLNTKSNKLINVLIYIVKI